MQKKKYPITGKQFKLIKEENKKIKIKELLPYARYYKPYKKFIFLIIGLFLINVAIGIIFPIFSGHLIASFTGNFNPRVSLCLGLITLGINLISCVFSYLVNKLCLFCSACVVVDMKKELIRRLNNITSSCFDNAQSGTFSTRLFSDVNILSNFPIRSISYVMDIISRLGFITYTFALNVYVGLVMLATTIITILIEFFRVDRREKQRRFIRKLGEKENSLTMENIRGMKDIRGLNTTTSISSKIDELITQHADYSHTCALQNQMISRISLVISSLLSFAFIVLCVYLIYIDQIVLATFMIVYNYRGKVTNFANYIVTIKSFLAESSSSAQRLNEILDPNKYPVETFGQKTFESVQGKITFKNVSFGYIEDKAVLNGISFEIEPNTMVSFVGKSGTGKTTIVSLINKIYTLEENHGEILLDDVNINDLTKDCLRDNVCVVSQQPYIFNMTVAENLRIANPNATEQQLESVLKDAQLFDYIDCQPDKLNTVLGENGLKLSGGQKQRLAIARALLKDCKVLVFDEATSSLDNENQAKIKEVISSLKTKRTIIVVAHRLSTVVDSDNIILIEDGNIISQGTHSQLMENCEQYQKLYKV